MENVGKTSGKCWENIRNMLGKSFEHMRIIQGQSMGISATKLRFESENHPYQPMTPVRGT